LTDLRGTDPGELVYLGHVEKPHGLKGALKVRVFVGAGEASMPLGLVLLAGGEVPLTVSRCTDRGGYRFNLTFEEIRSREEAEEYRNRPLFIPRGDVLSRLDFIPLHFLRGLVIRSRGNDLVVVDVEPSDANPLLLVDDGERRFQVPLLMVTSMGEIDWDAMRVEADLPPGLESL
jgi:ribosomal 30S subunit maturation factor RimM